MSQGCAILVQEHIPCSKVESINCGAGVHVQGVSLQFLSISLHIHNVHRSPQVNLDVGELLTSAGTVNAYIGGDFKAHHPFLHSPIPTSTAGRHIAKVMREKKVSP